ncbi:MAG: hypothetical protein IPK97_02285 [Ahniella sp.]|nr:hypothetical protein [Ahniella sp.]
MRISPCLEQNLQMIIEAERRLDAYLMHTYGQSPGSTSSAAAEDLLSVLHVGTNWPDVSLSNMEERIGVGPSTVDELNRMREKLNRDRLVVALRLALLSGERDLALTLLDDLQGQTNAHNGADTWDLGDLSLDRMNEIRRILSGEQGTTLICPSLRHFLHGWTHRSIL